MRAPVLVLLVPALILLGCGKDRSTEPIEPHSVIVKPDGSGDFATIQAALDAASPGSIVELTDGVFAGEGNCDLDFKGKALTLRSRSGRPSACVIQCQSGWSRGFYFHSGEHADARVEGVMIEDGTVRLGGAVLCEGASPTLTRCIFYRNFASGGKSSSLSVGGPAVPFGAGGGVYCSASDAIIEGCTFIENMGDFGGALYATSGSSPTIRGCTMHGNASMVGGGITCSDSCHVVVEASLICFSASGGAVDASGSSVIVLSCSNLFGNEGGDWRFDIADQLGLRGNLSADPRFCEQDSVELRVRADSPCSADSSGCGPIGAWEAQCSQ
jgi:hypothetical protein